MNPFDDTPFELRVLEGEQQGARRRVQPGIGVTVSGGLDSDVVLRAADFGERRIRLTAVADGVQLDVLQGEVAVGAHSLGAGQQLRIGLGTRVQLGRTAIGIGPADEADWSSAASEPAPAPVPDNATAATANATPTAPATPSPARAPRKWWQWLVAGGATLATVSMGMLAFALHATPVSTDRPQQAAQIDAALRSAGFPALSTRHDADGRLRVSGHLASAAERARVEQLLASAPLPVRLDVWVDDQVATAVLDVLRVNGVAATAQSRGQGAVVVDTREADTARLDRVQALARRDVPGLNALEVRNVPPPVVPARAAAPVIDDPGKRIAAIVSGRPPEVPPYLVTADGTRYFEGALLPTGHRIASIGQHQVMLEKDGQQTPLIF